jgi:hypothetical protein
VSCIFWYFVPVHFETRFTKPLCDSFHWLLQILNQFVYTISPSWHESVISKRQKIVNVELKMAYKTGPKLLLRMRSLMLK